jgi:heme-degrading monooxygenase HmoA
VASFLSDEWLAELAEALRREPRLADGPQLLLGQVVTDIPELENAAEVRYTIRLGGGEPAAVFPGEVSDAQVTLVEDYETARALATGTAAASMLAAGRVKVRGDATALMAAQEQLAALGDALGALALGTHFPEVGTAVAGGPVIEQALITVAAERAEEFVAAFPAAREVIESAPGCESVRLLRGVENPATFLLLVRWRTLEDHTVEFRESPLFTQWRAIVGPFFAAPPSVEHFVAADR